MTWDQKVLQDKVVSLARLSQGPSGLLAQLTCSVVHRDELYPVGDIWLIIASGTIIQDYDHAHDARNAISLNLQAQIQNIAVQARNVAIRVYIDNTTGKRDQLYYQEPMRAEAVVTPACKLPEFY